MAKMENGARRRETDIEKERHTKRVCRKTETRWRTHREIGKRV